MARKSVKYSKDLDVIAYRAIALCGSDSAVCSAIGITPSTFYRWLKTNESFRKAVEKGKEFNSKTSPDALRLGLMGYIVNVLERGGEQIQITQRKTIRTVQRDRRNNIIGVTEIEEVIETVENKGLPKWVADKIMANAPGLNEAILKVVNAGYEVIEEGDGNNGDRLLSGN